MTGSDSSKRVLDLEAEAEERWAKAWEYRSLAAAEDAEAHRLMAEARRCAAITPITSDAVQITRTDYARRCSVSDATVSRWLADGMPSVPVGSTVRIDPRAADDWRRARGRKPTTPEPKQRNDVPAEVDVSSSLAASGLRAVNGGR